MSFNYNNQTLTTKQTTNYRKNKKAKELKMKQNSSKNPVHAHLENPKAFSHVEDAKEHAEEPVYKNVNTTELGIHMVSVYQAITFEKKKHSLFYTDSTKPNKYPNVKITIRGDLGLVEIKSSTDHIMVPFANVSGIFMQTETRLKEIEQYKQETKTKFNPKESDIKRPR
jgi:hypothetical protein